MKQRRKLRLKLNRWQVSGLLLTILLILLGPQLFGGINWLGHTLMHEWRTVQVIDKQEVTTQREACMQRVRPGVCVQTTRLIETNYLLRTSDETLLVTSEQYAQVAIGSYYKVEVSGWSTPFSQRRLLQIERIR